MPKNKHEALLLKLRNNYAAMHKDKHDALLLKKQESYAAMPKDKKDTLLLHSRGKYANLTPEERTIILRSKRETYGKIKCTIKREALLAHMRKTTHGLRDAYTTNQMLRVTEQNAERQREIRLRVTNHDESTRQDLPPGQTRNIESWNLSSIWYF